MRLDAYCAHFAAHVKTQPKSRAMCNDVRRAVKKKARLKGALPHTEKKVLDYLCDNYNVDLHRVGERVGCPRDVSVGGYDHIAITIR